MLSKLATEKLQVLLYLAIERESNDEEAIAKKLGVDVKKIKKEAKAQAAVQKAVVA